MIGNGLQFTASSGTNNADYVSAVYEIPDGHGGYITLGDANVETISFWQSIPSRAGNWYYAVNLPGDWSAGVYAGSLHPRMVFNSRGSPYHDDWNTAAEDQWGNEGFYARQDGTGFVANAWELVTMVYYGGNAYTSLSAVDLYVNGKYIATGPDLGGFSNGAIPLPTPTANLQIGSSWNGSLNDIGIWKEALTGSHDVTTMTASLEATTGSAGEIAALYNTPMYNNHTGALSQYGVSAMDKLFTVYDSASTSIAVVSTSDGALGWKYVASGLTVGSGNAAQLVNGRYAVQLDAGGGGVETLMPGDANLDDRVDINDLTVVLAHYGQAGMGWSQGEFTGSGRVDINDLTIVLAHYGRKLRRRQPTGRRPRAERPGAAGRRRGWPSDLRLAEAKIPLTPLASGEAPRHPERSEGSRPRFGLDSSLRSE